MGIVSWARSRFGGKTESRGFDRVVPEEEEEQQQRQCPQVGLLSIGTFGSSEHPPPEQDDDGLPEFTVEEAKKLHDALARLLRRARSKHSARGSETDCPGGLPLDRFLNCPSSLEVDRRVQRKEGGEDDGDLSPNTEIILAMAKDLLVSTHAAAAGIKKKSVKFLLKKMFVCGGGAGFAPAPTLKDPVETRMDKFFRTVLGKKINVRPSNGTASRSCFLEDKPKEKRRAVHRRRREEEEEEDSCRWDRTDSEFIVLEI